MMLESTDATTDLRVLNLIHLKIIPKTHKGTAICMAIEAVETYLNFIDEIILHKNISNFVSNHAINNIGYIKIEIPPVITTKNPHIKIIV